MSKYKQCHQHKRNGYTYNRCYQNIKFQVTMSFYICKQKTNRRELHRARKKDNLETIKKFKATRKSKSDPKPVI